MSHRNEDGVQLPPGVSGSQFFHRVLSDTVAAFPHVFDGVRIPPAGKPFKQSYAETLVRFEGARVASNERVAVARFMTRRTQEQLVFRKNGSSVALIEHLASHNDAPQLTRQTLPGVAGLVPEVPFEGHTYRGPEVASLVALLRQRKLITDRAASGIGRLLARVAANDGALDLTGQRFAVLGAGAELAPTLSLLQAGATVLWIDLAPPDAMLARHAGNRPLAGTLVTAPDASDILGQPLQIAAAITAFAAEGPVHLGLFAYAPGAGRELRLAAAMDAIARSLDPGLLASVAMYISPTTPATVQPEDRAAVTQRLVRQPLWQAALTRVNALATPAHHTHGEHAIARAVVPLQGPGYQAAQYLAKMASAESWATHGSSLNGAPPLPMTVSANVAGISKTRSIEHPLFQAAFAGAAAFGVQIFDAATTRSLSALLMLNDVLDPDAPGAASSNGVTPAQKAAQTFSQQVHGGAYSLPWHFPSTIRAAAIVGLARRPWLLWPRR